MVGSLFWSTSGNNMKRVVYIHLVRDREMYQFVKALSVFC